MSEKQIYLLVGLAAAIGVALWIRETVAKARRNRRRDRMRTLETLLLPKEAVKSVCESKSGSWILTNKRLIIQEKAAYTAFPFRRIKKVQGHGGDGKTTASPAKMASLTVTAEKEFVLYRADDSFEDFVRQLKAKTKKKKKTGK